MTRDFTFEMYEQLLEAGLDAGYENITIREYLSAAELPEQFIIYRHDVDRKPENALAMANLEAEYDIESTYYVRTIQKTFKPELIRRIEALGHEIGYHYEDMDREDGNLQAAHESFRRELNRLREYARVNTICMHGNPLTPYDNRDMWNDQTAYERYNLLGEAYLSMDFADLTYFSDTGRTWIDGELKIKDTPVGETNKMVNINTTPELIQILRNETPDRLCILVHPNRWAESFSEYVVEYSKDKMTNLGKRGLNMVRSQKIRFSNHRS